MRRATGGRNALSQHEVVGRELALATEPCADHPGERVEPPDTAQRFGRQLQQPVAAARVRELVQQHDAHPLCRPLGRRRRQHDDRPPPAPCRHQAGERSEHQVGAASQAARPREIGAQPMPPAIRRAARRRAEPSESRQPDQEHANAGDRPQQPDRHGHPADDVAAGDDRRRGSLRCSRQFRHACTGCRFREEDVGTQPECVEHERCGRSHSHHRWDRQNVECRRSDRCDDPDRQHPALRGGRAPAQAEGADQRQEQDRRHLDGQHGQQTHHGSSRSPLLSLPSRPLPRDAD